MSGAVRKGAKIRPGKTVGKARCRSGHSLTEDFLFHLSLLSFSSNHTTPPSSSSLKINACDSDSSTHLTWAAHPHLSYHIRSRHVALLLLYLTLIPIFSYSLREAKGGSGLSHHISGTGRRLFVIKARYFAVQVGSCYLADTISHWCFIFSCWGGGGCGAQTRILMLCTNFGVPHG